MFRLGTFNIFRESIALLIVWRRLPEKSVISPNKQTPKRTTGNINIQYLLVSIRFFFVVLVVVAVPTLSALILTSQ
jgi:hypothetical protein